MGNYTVYSNVYNKTGLSSNEVATGIVSTFITEAEAELEMVTGRVFTNANTFTDILNSPMRDILGINGTYAISCQLSNYPVQSIISFTTLNADNSTDQTFAALTSTSIAAGTYFTTDYWLYQIRDQLNGQNTPTGRIILTSQAFYTGWQNIKVNYTFGYATPPEQVIDLANCLAGIRTWLYFMGASYNRFNSYTIPQQTADKGDFYQRGKDSIKLLSDEAERLYNRIGKRSSTYFASTGFQR